MASGNDLTFEEADKILKGINKQNVLVNFTN